MSEIKRKFLKIVKIIKMPEMEILPGHLAFSLVISIAPILTIFVLIASYLSVSVESLVNFMINSFPTDVSKLLIPFIEGSSFNLNVGISLIIGLLIASNGLYSIVTTSNALYKKESSTTLRRRIKAMILALMLVFLFIFILIVLAFGNNIIKLISMAIVDQNIIQTLYDIFVLLKWPIGFVAIFFTINLIYALAPDSPISSKYTRRGALLTTISWMVVTAVYSYYVSNIARYDIFYGGLSSIMVMMIWVYILSYIFVLGIAINSSSYEMEINTNDNNKNFDNTNNDIH
ncbi:MAG: YihY/virulence factor BrkB family protein [Bacilli bacterium]|nr:YihY/virulence factor BrkB family protein [Bacilli bacterium]MDD4282337.1 YihY/virulence factor BrkB family protein [Bacilli bacterium]MDD4718964.1 YihY/virulence factor BrkB family protein [Bacilli bacterium]